jgi:hypothetical protein
MIRRAGSLLSRKVDDGARLACDSLATAQRRGDKLDVVEESPEPGHVR